jgi:dinuclear metal center YbgI/SA1388 family protein
MNIFKVNHVTSYFESLFPLQIQEDYDNSGLIIGHYDSEIQGVIVCLNVTKDVIEEAIKTKCNFIISHHPIIFNGLKRINGRTDNEQIVEKCIKNDICIYTLHTNIDKCFPGLNWYIAQNLGLENVKVLAPESGYINKLITYVPKSHENGVREALFNAGAGKVGNYDSCSFNTEGFGTFRGLEGSQQFVGQIGTLHKEREMKIELIYPSYLEKKILSALFDSHPYEEVAFDILQLENQDSSRGLGAVGVFPTPMSTHDFFALVKEKFQIPIVRYSGSIHHPISKIALCGGSGSFLAPKAKQLYADAYITSDIKYHEFDHQFDNFLMLDCGHFETEIFFKNYIVGLLKKNFTNFAIRFAESEKNHIYYY